MRVTFNSEKFDSKGFIAKLEKLIETHPEKAIEAYSNAAEKLRSESQNHPEERVHLHALAMRLDQLAEHALEIEQTILGAKVDKGDGNHELTTDWHDVVEDVASSKVDERGLPRSEFAAAAALQRTIGATGGGSNGTENGFRITPASAIPGLTNFGSMQLVQFGGNAGTGSYSAGTTGNNVVPQTEAQCVRWDGREFESQCLTLHITNPANVLGPPSNPTAYNKVQGADFNGMFGYLPPPFGTSSRAVYRPYFHIFFGGSKGLPAEVYGDVGRGVTINLAANFLYVNVGCAYKPGLVTLSGSSQTAGLSTTAGSMMLGAFMGFFSSAKTSQVYYTWYLDAASSSPNTEQLIPIPPFATTLEAFYSPNPSWSVYLVTALGETVANVDVTKIGTRGNAVPLPGDVYGISCFNRSGSVQSARIVYGLSL